MIPTRFTLADSLEGDALPRVATTYDAFRAIIDGAMGLEFVGQRGRDGQPTPFFWESRIITQFLQTFRKIIVEGKREQNLNSARGGLVAHETRTRQLGSILWIENPTDEPITGSVLPYLPEVTVAPKSIFPYVHDAPIGSGASYLGAYAGLVKSDAPVLTAYILPDPHDGIRVYVYGEPTKSGETREVAIWSGNDRGRGVEVEFTATPQFYPVGTSQVVALPTALAGRVWLPANLDGGAPVLIGPDDVLAHEEWEATVALASGHTHTLYSLRPDGAITEIVVDAPAPSCATDSDFDDAIWREIDLAADGNGRKSGWYRALVHLPDGDGGDAQIHFGIGDNGEAAKRLTLWVNGVRVDAEAGSVRLRDGTNRLCLFVDSNTGFGPVSVTPSGGCYLIDVARWRFAVSVAPVTVTIAL